MTEQRAMAERRRHLDRLPAWPRGLSLQLAAAYIGVSTGFLQQHIPVQPVRVGRRCIYDRRALDRWLDNQEPENQTRSTADWLEALDGGDAAARD